MHVPTHARDEFPVVYHRLLRAQPICIAQADSLRFIDSSLDETSTLISSLSSQGDNISFNASASASCRPTRLSISLVLLESLNPMTASARTTLLVA